MTGRHLDPRDSRPAQIGRVFLIRHGRTALHADRRLRGHLDPPLDEIGHREAAALGAALWEWRIVKILSSPLLRALQTASAIGEVAGVSVTAVDDLIDRDLGRWAGQLEAAVATQFGAVGAAPGVEPMETVADRSCALLEDQLPVLERGHIVLVSHDAVLQALLTRLDPAVGPSLNQATGCWNEVRRTQDRWVVSLVNQKPLLATDAVLGHASSALNALST